MTCTREEFARTGHGWSTEDDLRTSYELYELAKVAQPYIRRVHEYRDAHPDAPSNLLCSDIVPGTEEEREAAFIMFKHDMFVSGLRGELDQPTLN